MNIDIDQARRDTPGCEHVLHFNNAGAALMPRIVLEAVEAHFELEAEIGGYEAAEHARPRIDRVYDETATLLNCHRDEVAMVENATRAWDMAFYAVDLKPGDRVLTAVAEYAANYVAFLHAAKRTGAVIEVVPNDESGQLSVEALARMIDDRVKLVAITHVPTNGGLVNPAAAIGKITREAGVLYLLDACQSVGQMPIDVEAIGCDMLSATGRKFLRGPRGTGFLYVRRSALDRLDPPILDHHAAEWVARDRYQLRPDARRFECWEANYALRIGLGAAIDYALQWGLENIRVRAFALADELRRQLATIPGVEVHDIGAEKCAIVTFTVEGREPAEVKRELAHHRMNVTVSDRASTRLDFEERDLRDLVRASVHYYNDEDEIERFCSAVEDLSTNSH
jgi:cysteine desulfurase / selenocysteine lyase